MTQTVIIALPALMALAICIVKGPDKAVLNVYLPALLLLPSYQWSISGELTFTDAILLVIVFFLLFQAPPWRWNVLDLLIVAYLLIIVLSFGINLDFDYKKTQNFALREFCSLFLPYYVAKQTAGREQFAVDLAKRITVLLALVGILSMYEFRMGRNLILMPFSGIFPGPTGDTILYRSGFRRVQGPFGHPMSLGVIMAFGYVIAVWLDWRSVWHERLHFMPIRKISLTKFWILAGLGMSISYGDWIGAAAAAVMLAVCRARRRKLALVLVILCGLTIGLPLYSVFKAYVSADWHQAQAAGDSTRSDAAYRSELLKVYIPVVEERPAWGWGHDYPVIEGMKSIDNCYLWIALVFGLYALAIWVAILLCSWIPLCVRGLQLPRNNPAAAEAFSLAAIYIVVALCSTEGALMAGAQVSALLFFITGWSAALLHPSRVKAFETQLLAPSPRREVAFERVMV